MRASSRASSHHAGAGAAALRPARERHHAIGAALVAAFDDRDVGAVRIVAARERRVESLVGVQAQTRDAPVAGFELHQHLRQLGVAGRSRHQADVRRAFEDLLAFLLRHAAQHGEHLALAGSLLNCCRRLKTFLLGLVANAAGVVENQFGFFGLLHLRIALGEQRADDFFRIVHIHLAPEGLDVEGLHARGSLLL